MPWTLDVSLPSFNKAALLDHFARAALNLACFDPPAAATELYNGLRGFDRKAQTQGQLAAEMWLQVLTVAAVIALRRVIPDAGTEALRTSLADFLRPIHERAHGAVYDAAELEDPSSFAPCRRLVAELPNFLARVAPEKAPPSRHTLEQDVRNALSRVGGRHWERYEAVLTPQDGPVAAKARRVMAWTQHAAWIRARFDSRRLPLIENGPTLADVYVRLRCFHHEEIEAEKPDAPTARFRADRMAHVGDLHETVAAWLTSNKPRDAVRLVCGGPGSGKSSFAVAFAVETLDLGEWNVAFVNLQHLMLKGDLHDDLGDYLKRAKDGAGLGFNPLDELAGDGKPLLFVFDGLDELARSDDRAEELTRRFVDRAKRMIEALQSGELPVKALVLGRSAAAESARREAGIDLPALLHVLKMSPATYRDMSVNEDQVVSPPGLLERDQRAEAWPRWRTILPDGQKVPPEAVTDEDIEGLNAEPLLLTLLLISGFAGDKWPEAKDNRNRVYEAIFDRVRERDRDKGQPAGSNLTREDFFLLMECLGMAAWRGGGRTGAEEDFAKLRNKRCPRRFATMEAATLRNVATQFYTRADLDDTGYEFIHKSFGEYLTGRGLLRDALKLARDLEEKPPEQIAPDWLEITAPAEMTHEVLRFLRDEARLRANTLSMLPIQPLVELINWAIHHGFPAHALGLSDFNAAIRANRHAHGALLAAVSALICATRPTDSEERRLAFDWGDDRSTPQNYLFELGRLGQRWNANTCLQEAILRGVNLYSMNLNGAELCQADMRNSILFRTQLFKANLIGADLTGADLAEADLEEAMFSFADLRSTNFAMTDCRNADFEGADFSFADLEHALNLTQSQVDSAYGNEHTSLPPGIERPASWLQPDSD